MPLAGALAASAVLLLLVLGAAPSCHGVSKHNITEILATRSDFTEFSAALSSTGAAAEIDGQQTVTVLAVNNTVMAQLKALQLQPKDLQRVIYLQVLFDYFDAAKLRSIQESPVHVTSLYQASGKAQGSAGMENVTVLGGGRFAFSLFDHPADAPPPPPVSFYQKPIHESPYDIAVLQVSALVGSPAPPLPLAPAPASSPAHAAAAPAPVPVSSPPAPSSSPANAAAAPSPAPVSSPPHAAAAPAPAPVLSPPEPALAPVVAPATPPTPRRRPAPSPEAEDTPAPAPDAADSEPPADQKNNGARDTAPWSLGAAAVAAAIVLLLW